MADLVLGTVSSIQGTVHVRAANGSVRVLHVGDVVHEGETVLTIAGGQLQLTLSDGAAVSIGPGQIVAMTAELSSSEFPGADESGVADVDRIVQAVLGGGDLDQMLEATAAGPGGGGGENTGHGFVRLLRISEGVTPAGTDSTSGVELPAPAIEQVFTLQNTPPAAAVTPGNEPPVALDDAVVTDEDTPVTVAVLANDSDGDGDALSVSSFTQGANGTVVLNGDGTFTYTPNADFNGGDSFSYTVSDGNGGSDTATVTVGVNPVNDPPVALDDAVVTDEDTPVTVAVLANDSDVDGDALGVSGFTQGANGTVVLNGDGTFTYTPNADFNGGDSFSYTVSDGNGGSDTATVTVSVNPLNNPPVALDDAASTDEDAPVSISVLGNDSDVDGDALGITGFTQAANGSVVLNGDGTFTYTPDADFNGSDAFTYTISDGNGGSATATVTLAVNPVNDPPVAVDDAASTDEDAPVSISVLGNDSDVDGDALGITGFTQAANGSVVLNGDGTFTYTPDADFNGSDAFTYTISDGNGGSDTATVTVGVNPVNDPPVARDDAVVTDEGTPVTVAVLDNDSDVDGDALSVSDFTQGAHGTVVLNADGSFTYTPTGDFSGSDSFTYTVSDGNGGSDSATVSIVVNPVDSAPQAADDAYVVNEDASLVIAASGVLGNDSIGSDGGTLAVVGYTAPSHGSLTLNADGSFIYTPEANYNGPDSFSYTIRDVDGDEDTATVVINVAPVNDLPTAGDDAYEVNEDGSLVIAAPGVLGNDTLGGDGGTLAVVSYTTPAHGSLTLNANGSFTYTPDANYNGADSFSYTIRDANGDEDTATVAISVGPVNDVPDAVNDSYAVNEDASLVIAAPGVLGNDSIGGDGGTLAVVAYTNPTHGTLYLNANGSFTYTPDANYNGADSFSYTIRDTNGDEDTATVNIGVNPVDDQPVAADDAYAVNEDASLVIAASGVLGNDSIGGDGGTLAVVSYTTPAHGSLTLNADGSFTYTPDANYNGADSFSYTICDVDGDESTATVNLTVNPVNDLPDAVNDSYAVNEDASLVIAAPGVLGNDSIGGDGGTLAVVSYTTPTHGNLTLNANGSFTYTPDANYNGADSFSYTIRDANGDEDTATVNLSVNPVDDQPTAVNNAYAVNEDASLVIAASGVLGNDSIGGDGGTLAVVSYTTPAHGSLTLNADGSFSYTPDANYNGADSFSYTIRDADGDESTATVNLTVNPVNDLPDAINDSYAVNEDASLVIVAPGVLGNDSIGGDGGTLAVVAYTNPTHGSLTLNANGSFTYTPDANYNGADSFSYTIRDANGDEDTATVNLTVNPVNDLPDAVNDSYAVNEDADLVIAAPGVLGNDSIGGDGGTLAVVAYTDPTHGTLKLNANGSFTYTPDANYNGADSFSYTIRDADGDEDTATVNLSVNPVDDQPVAVNDSYAVNEDASLVIAASGVLGNDSIGGDGGTLAVVAYSNPTHGTLTLNANGSFTYTPDANYNGADSFSYTIRDADGDEDTATVNLTVNPVNDLPDAVNDSYAVNEDASLVIAATGVLGNDSLGGDGGTLAVVAYTNPVHGTLTLNANGSFTYTPDANYNGADSFSYTIRDANGDEDTATVNLTVNLVDDQPTAADDAYAVNEDASLVIAAPGVLGNDSLGGDGGTLAVVSYTTPAHGSVTLNADGSFTYTPNANYNGVDSFSYTIRDADGDEDTATVAINVNPVNDAPTLSGAASADVYESGLGNGTGTAPATTTVTGALAFADVEGQPLSLVVGGVTLGTLNPSAANAGSTVLGTHAGDYGTITFFLDGSWSYTLDANVDHDTDTTPVEDFVVNVSDGSASAAAPVTLHIDIHDDTPVVYSVQDAIVANTTGSVTGQIDFTYGADDDAGSRLFISSYNEIPGIHYDLSTDGSTLTARVGDASGEVFYVLHLNQDGSYTLDYSERPSSTSAIVFSSNGGSASVETLSAASADGAITMVFDGALYNGSSLQNYPGSNGANANDNIKPTGTGFGVGSANNQTVMNNNEGFIVTFAGAVAMSSVTGFAFDIVQQGGGASFTLHWNAYDGSTLLGSGQSAVTIPASQSVYGFGLDSAQFGDQGFDKVELWFTDVSGSNIRIEGFSLDYELFAPDQPLTFGVTAEDSDGTLSSAANFDVYLQGGAGPGYTLTGNGGDEVLVGAAGNDRIAGGEGNDMLTGGAGADTFVWKLADRGTPGSPAVDAITDFDTAPVASGGDALDLRDLLQGENSGNLVNYLHFEHTAGDTVVQISSSGGFSGGYSAGAVDQQIVLSGVDLTVAGNDAQIIQSMVDNGKLTTDT